MMARTTVLIKDAQKDFLEQTGFNLSGFVREELDKAVEYVEWKEKHGTGRNDPEH